MCMNKILIIFVALLLSGCAIYKVGESKPLNKYEEDLDGLTLDLGKENTPHCLGVIFQ